VPHPNESPAIARSETVSGHGTRTRTDDVLKLPTASAERNQMSNVNAKPAIFFKQGTEPPGELEGRTDEGGVGLASQGPLRRVVSSSLARRVATGAFWSSLGQVVSRALTLIGSVLVARQLGVTRYGELNLVLVTVGMFQNVAGFGLVTTSTRFLAGKYRTDANAAGHVVALSHLVSAATGWIGVLGVEVAASWLASGALAAPQLEWPLRIGAAMLLFGPIYGAHLGVLSGLERFRRIAFASVAGALLGIPLLVGGAAAAGTLGCVIGLVASMALTNAVFAGAVRSALREARIEPRYRGALREWRILFSFSLPTTLSNILLGAVTWGSSSILAHQAAGMREVGLFGAANQWRNGIVLLATSAGAALLPLFSDLHDSGRTRTLSRAFWIAFGLSSAACVAAASAVWLGAPLILRFYGTDFAGASDVLALLALSGALSAPLTIANHAIAGAGRMWLSLAFTAIWGGMLLAVAYALRDQGALGLSVAHVSAYAIQLILSVISVALLVRRAGVPSRPAAGSGR
jgi:O-antigen/teichoic acid export membrane protein